MPPITKRPKIVQTTPKVTARPFLEELLEAALESGVKVEEGKVDIEADDNDDEENDEENEDGDGTSPGSRAVYLQFFNFTNVRRH